MKSTSSFVDFKYVRTWIAGAVEEIRVAWPSNASGKGIVAFHKGPNTDDPTPKPVPGILIGDDSHFYRCRLKAGVMVATRVQPSQHGDEHSLQDVLREVQEPERILEQTADSIAAKPELGEVVETLRAAASRLREARGRS